MPVYSYEGRDLSGAQQTGTVEASSEQEASRRLRGDGLTVTRLVEGASKPRVDSNAVLLRQASRRVKREEVIAFSSQLSVMLDTGVPLADAMQAYIQQTRSGPLGRVVNVVNERLTRGVSFSVSIIDFPRVFPNIMVSLVKASEATGTLGAMLGRVSEYLARDRKTRRDIRGALTYPAVMVSMALIVTSFLVVWVLPRFASIYESREAALPRPTSILLSISAWTQANWWLLLGGIAAVAAGAWIFNSSKRGGRAVDWAKVHSPVVGPIFTNYYLSRVCRTLSALLGAGVTFPEAMKIVRGLVTNRLWDELWDELDESISTGRTIAEVFLASTLVPASAAQMISAGERTGKLPEVLDRIANVAESDLDESIKTGTQLIEPLMITFMGVLIGGIAMALLLPIFTMSNVMT